MDGKYQIGVYTLRPIAEGEEITFDYNSVTEVCTFLFSFIQLFLKLQCLVFTIYILYRAKKNTKHRSASVEVKYAGAAI